jgi:hypothetical protein
VWHDEIQAFAEQFGKLEEYKHPIDFELTGEMSTYWQVPWFTRMYVNGVIRNVWTHSEPQVGRDGRMVSSIVFFQDHLNGVPENAIWKGIVDPNFNWEEYD